jgi:hypothetical protein
MRCREAEHPAPQERQASAAGADDEIMSNGAGVYPQPREGVTGTDRDDDLLSLDEAAVPRRLLMAGLARCLRDAVLVGNPAPAVARMWERMKNPEPGDLVIETSTFFRKDTDDKIKAMGILVAHRTEWWQTDEEWAAEIEKERAAYEEFLLGPYSQPGDLPFDPSHHERLTDHAWYVQYGPRAADICRWVNCDFMMIPADPSEFRIRVGTRDGNGVMLTRDDLVGGLADAGFVLRLPQG